MAVPTPESRELGRRIRAARIAAGFSTQGTAAAQLGKPREFINRMESGRIVPYTPTLLRVVMGLRLDLLQLFPEAADWVGKPPEERWPEGHPDAELLKSIRGRGAPRGPRPPRGPLKGPPNPAASWPRGFKVATLSAEDIHDGDPNTASEDQG